MTSQREPRRIVTGHDADGRSVVAIDDNGPHRLGNLTELWTAETTPASNAGVRDGTDRKVRLAPPDGGSVFRFFQVPPQSTSQGIEADELARMVRDRFAAMDAENALVDTTRHPAMHKTRTVDYIILLSGRVTLLLDEAEVDLEPFDVVVQRGTSHAWVNQGDETALLAGVLIDAEAL